MTDDFINEQMAPVYALIRRALQIRRLNDKRHLLLGLAGGFISSSVVAAAFILWLVNT